MVSSNDVQRLFLQAVFSRGILSYQHALVLWAKCVDAVRGVSYPHKSAALPQLNLFSTAADPTLDVSASNKRADWDAFVVSINRALNCLDLEFRHVMDESTGLEMYAVVCGRNTGPHIIGG